MKKILLLGSGFLTGMWSAIGLMSFSIVKNGAFDNAMPSHKLCIGFCTCIFLIIGAALYEN